MFPSRKMILAASGLALALVFVGCTPPGVESPPVGGRSSDTRPSLPAADSSSNRDVIPQDRLNNPKFSWETEADHRFADFLKEKSAGMVRQAAVGVEKSGKLRIQVDSSVAPEDTLPLTKSILAGARKDFTGKAFTLSIYDPTGEPILRAHYDPDQGVRYQVVASKAEHTDSASSSKRTGAGASERDRKFAEWAERTGKDYLRYLEADLEKNGRLWFGVTKNVKPADVPELTKSILKGARDEFPRREIIATVFDPDGEKIGRARMGGDGQVHWER